MDIDHEYEVINAFFSRGAAWVAAESANVEARLSSSKAHTDEFVEELLFHPNGPGSLEDILCRATLNELNALIEAALQDALTEISGTLFIDDKGLIVGARRGDLEKALAQYGLQVTVLSEHTTVQQIKELAEGFKHRQGLRPLPKWNNAQKTLEYQLSVVAGFAHETIHGYEVRIVNVRDYLRLARVFLDQLRDQLRKRSRR